MLLEKKAKIAEVSEFSNFDLYWNQNPKMLESAILPLILTVIVTQVAKATKN